MQGPDSLAGTTGKEKNVKVAARETVILWAPEPESSQSCSGASLLSTQRGWAGPLGVQGQLEYVKPVSKLKGENPNLCIS